jgi:hypothetical protein
MADSEYARAGSTWRTERYCAAVFRHVRWLVLLLGILIPASRSAQSHQTAVLANPVPEPAIPAILAAFDKYEVVGLPQGMECRTWKISSSPSSGHRLFLRR